LLAASGQLDLARQQYETALAMRPDLQVARRALARIDVKKPDARSSAERPAVMAKGTRSTAHPLDAGVTPASTAAATIPPPSSTAKIQLDPEVTPASTAAAKVPPPSPTAKIQPPLPTRSLPAPRAASVVKRKAIPPPSSPLVSPQLPAP
jgi:hypothetical protein